MKQSKSVTNLQPSYIREILKAATSKDIISLAGGLPASDFFPMELIERALKKVVSNRALFQYGETKGLPELVNFLRTQDEYSGFDDLMITSGSQQGLDLLARAFLECGDVVAIESPGYIGALQVFALTSCKVVGILNEEDGPDLNDLEDKLKHNRIKFFYAVPDFQNPTGICWSLEKRKAVGALCQKYKVYFIEDAPYRELRFRGGRLPLVSSFCGSYAVMLQSFSKITTPGIRLGVVAASPEVIAPMIKVKQAADLHTGLPFQGVVLELLKENSLNPHLEMLKGIYRERCDFLHAALNTRLSSLGHSSEVDGGMFLWFKLHEKDPITLSQLALEKGVAVVPSSVFFVSDHDANVRALRLNFSHSDISELNEAVNRLSALQ